MFFEFILNLSLTFYRYGFVKYHNFKDAENCIRGFHHLGYETSFARVSVQVRLPFVIKTLTRHRSLSTLNSKSFRMMETPTFTYPTCPKK